MEIKNEDLIARLAKASSDLGVDHEQLIFLLLVSEEVVLPALQNIENTIETELVPRSLNQLSNLKAIRSQVLNLHADGMESSDRAVAFARIAGEMAEEFVLENGGELLKDQLFFAQKPDFSDDVVHLDKEMKSLLEIQCAELNITLSEMVNYLLKISSNVPMSILRLEKLFSVDLVVNYIAAQAEIQALRFEINGLHSALDNNPDRALKCAEHATAHGFNSVLKKNKLED